MTTRTLKNKEREEILRDIRSKARNAMREVKDAESRLVETVRSGYRKEILAILSLWSFRGLGGRPVSKSYQIGRFCVKIMLKQDRINIYHHVRDDDDYISRITAEDGLLGKRIKFSMWEIPEEDTLSVKEMAEFYRSLTEKLGDFVGWILDQYKERNK